MSGPGREVREAAGAAPAPAAREAAVLGAVLAGGRSQRFGRDKAHVRLGELTLLERAVRTLRDVLQDVLIVSGDPSHAVAGAHRIPDLRPGRGPLAGIEAALDRAAREGREGVFVLACDLPGVGPGIVGRILTAREGHAAVAPARDGRPGHEPLCAYYATGCGVHAARLLDAGRDAAHELLRAAGGIVLPHGEGASFRNVNTPGDLAAAAADAARGEAPGSARAPESRGGSS